MKLNLEVSTEKETIVMNLILINDAMHILLESNLFAYTEN